MTIEGAGRESARRDGRRHVLVRDVMGHVAIAVMANATFGDIVAALRRFKVGAVAVVAGERRVPGVGAQHDLLLRAAVAAPPGVAAHDGGGPTYDPSRVAAAPALGLMSSP